MVKQDDIEPAGRVAYACGAGGTTVRIVHRSVLRAGTLAALLIVRVTASSAGQESGTPTSDQSHAPVAKDVRKPMPVLPSLAAHQKSDMRNYLAAVQDIIAALMRDDFTGVANAAARIGYSDAAAQTCRHMGEATPGFADAAIKFHRTADEIGDAAHRADRTAVLEALGHTLKTCVDCHASYRQEVVDPTTWQRLIGGGTVPR